MIVPLNSSFTTFHCLSFNFSFPLHLPPISSPQSQTRPKLEMDAVTDQPSPCASSDTLPTPPDVSLHSQPLDLDELLKFDTRTVDPPPFDEQLSVLPMMSVPIDIQPSDIDHQEIPHSEIDLDDILPSESFSTQVTPTGSLVNGVAPRKPPISIFQTPPDDTPEPPVDDESTVLPSPPATPDRKKQDDVPGRYSDVEDSPPLEAAGFVGDEIPMVDPLDSDGEWCKVPKMGDLPTLRALSQIAGEDAEASGLSEDKKKKKRRNKKSKGVRSPTSRLTSSQISYILSICDL